MVPCLIQSLFLLLCVLSMFMDLKPPEKTLQEHAALPANLTLPLTTEPGHVSRVCLMNDESYLEYKVRKCASCAL